MSPMFARRARAAGLSLALMCLGEAVLAQAPVARSDRIFTVNPLGLLQFGPTVEFEKFTTPYVGVALGLRIPSFGLLSHVIDPDIEFAWLAMGQVRFHQDARRPAGWWWGPRVEVGISRSAGEQYNLIGGGLEVGHNRISASGRVLALGAIAGMFKSDGGLSGAFVMGVLSLGRIR
jgi:hypothetical protein